MKAVFQEYAGVIVAVIVASVLFFFLHNITDGKGNHGIWEILESVAESGEEDIKMTDLGAIKNYSARTKPEVFFQRMDENGAWQEIRAGEEISLYDFLSGVDCDSTPVELSILKIESADGQEDLTDTFDATDGSICFPHKGSYSIYIHMIDVENVEVVRKINIPVDAPA